MDITTVVLFVLTALVFLLSGTRNLRTPAEQTAPTVQTSRWRLSRSLLQVIGSLELLAVAGLLAGLVFPPFGIAAAAGLVLLMIGAIAYHLLAREPLMSLLFPAVPLLLSTAAVAVFLVYLYQGAL